MHDDNNYRVRERRVSKDGKQAGFGKYGCASIILLIMIGPFLILGLSQLIDTIKVSNRHESKLAIQYLQSKYGEAFKVVRGTVNYNTPLQMITLKASSEAEPDIIFSTKAYIGGSERFYWDDLLSKEDSTGLSPIILIEMSSSIQSVHLMKTIWGVQR